MQVPHSKGVANHTVPESCVRNSREARHEALTGVRVGQPLSREIHSSRVPTLLFKWKATRAGALLRVPTRPCAVRDPGMRVRSLHGNREICGLATERYAVVRIGKARSRSR